MLNCSDYRALDQFFGLTSGLSLSDYFLLISKIGPKDGSLLKVMQIRTHDKLLF